MIGDGSAPAFFRVNADNGLVTVGADLRTASEIDYVVCTYKGGWGGGGR